MSTNNTGVLSSSTALTMGGGTLNVQGKSGAFTTNQTVASLVLTTGSSSIVLNPNGGTSTTLTITSNAITNTGGGTVNFNYTAGTTNGATVGNDIVDWNPALTSGIIGSAYTVTDAGGFGLATVNAFGQVVRYVTNATGLPASGALATNDYNLNLNSDTVTPGSLFLIQTATQAANTLTVDTTAAAGTFNLGATTLNTTAIFISGPNTFNVTGTSAGALGTSGSILYLYNNNAGLVTIGAAHQRRGRRPDRQRQRHHPTHLRQYLHRQYQCQQRHAGLGQRQRLAEQHRGHRRYRHCV